MIREGPKCKFDYYSKPEKSDLDVDAVYFNEAYEMFSPFEASIVEGSRVLGGFVGSKREGDIWVSSKVKWLKSKPQAVYVAVSKSLQNE